MVLQEILQGKPEDTAICGEKNISYRELKTWICRYRGYFYANGVRAGENVGLMARNSAEFIYAYFAIASLGAVAVPINFQLAAREAAYIIQDAGIRLLVVDESCQLDLQLQEFKYGQNLSQISFAEINTALEQQAYEKMPDIPVVVKDENICTMIYTSGTTGVPKGALLTHRNLTSNAQMFLKAVDLKRDDTVLCVLPMYHCFAWTCAVLNPFLAGARITILEAFAPKDMAAVVCRFHVSVVYAVPSICNLLLRSVEKHSLETVRTFIVGGTSLPMKIAEDFLAKFGIYILEGYGLSEASPVVAVNTKSEHRAGSIGKPLPMLEVKITDAKGQPVQPGQPGELLVRGENVMQGYYHLPEETKAALQDGWLHTGDVAIQDADGYLFIVDRLKELIISSGENVYPREIEELLYRYPGIVEAAVIGMEDRLRGQAPAAYIVAAKGMSIDQKALKAYLKERLAIYKVPRTYYFVASLPKSQTGKIVKRLLKEMNRSGMD